MKRSAGRLDPNDERPPMRLAVLYSPLLPAELEVTGWSIAGTDGRLLRHQGLALTRGRLSVHLHGLAPGLHVLQLYSAEGRVRTVRFAVE